MRTEVRQLSQRRIASYQHDADNEEIVFLVDESRGRRSTSQRRFFLRMALFLFLTSIAVVLLRVAATSQTSHVFISNALTMNIWWKWPNEQQRQYPPTEATAQALVRAKLEELHQQIDGNVFFADDYEKFVNAATVWIHGVAAPPLVVVEAHTEADVAKTVPVLVELKEHFKLPFSVRAGGHHKAGFSTCPGGAVLSLRKMNRIRLPSSPQKAYKNTTLIATIQPGVRDEDFLNHVLRAHGYAGVFGYCPSVGLVGFAMGGGLGIQSRLYGLGMDQIVGARIVLANGTIVKAPSDLLWALRGAGGGNFGVVTELEYRIEPAYDGLAAVMVTLPTPSHSGSATGSDNDLSVDFLSRLGDLEIQNKLPRNLVAMFDAWDRVSLLWSARDEASFEEGYSYMDDLLSHRMGPNVANAKRETMTIQWTSFYGALQESGGAKTLPWQNPVYKAACWYGFLHPENNTVPVWNNILESFSRGFRDCPHLMVDVELWCAN